MRVAEHRALVGADVSGLPPGEGAQVAAAVEAASVSAFHTGMGISAALVGLGGILGIVARPHALAARCCAEDCAGGQLVAAPLEAARERDAGPRRRVSLRSS